MNTVQRIAKNTLLLYVATIMTAAMSMVLTIYLARMLGDVTYGKYSFAVVFTGFFGILTNLGMNELLIREVARDKSRATKYLGNMMLMRLILSVVVLAIIAIVINLMDYPRDTTIAVYIFGAYTILTYLGFIFRMTFRAFEKMEYEAALNVLERVITTSLGLLILFTGFGLIEVAYVFLIAGAVNLLLSFLVCAKIFAKPKLEIDLDFWKKTVRLAVPFTLSNVFVMIYGSTDTFMLSVMKGDAVVGWYNAPYNLIHAFAPVVSLFMTAAYPVMSRLFVSSKDSLNVAYEKSSKYLIVLGLAVSVGGMVLADRIIPFLFGGEFVNSIATLQVLIWNCLLICIYHPILYLLGSINRQGQMAIAGLIGAVANIGLNLILIPRWSYIGAGVATLISGSITSFACWYIASKYLYKLPIHRILVKPLIASGIMGIAVYWLNQATRMNLFLLIASGAVLYLTGLYLLRTFSKEDRELFKQVFRVKRRVS